ncbi:uncharacterized protein A1O9_06550 [Exophiala aquamarina CBS 119918]|uniref:BD-FAE-like domain-containing protein n=1 Tax=Exophiala aquamarina CBS 119918 TaxID=1182545 RepID=A0A072PES5_9EURO|nr:uncharacterized protein A1O9_06550 [Exophiala aquamarina CBS 119918]KEF58624.1 hypothetical protein A1O9_06550 [Exophiala aquamarina CBS 119918]
MDSLSGLGTAIGAIIPPTYKAYQPLLLRNADKIRSTAQQTYSYGPHPRQTLDIYTPSSTAAGGLKNSVLLFLYGGGLVRGDKINPSFAEGLTYSNIGHFFTEHLGVPVVVVDYRLLSHGAVFPSGGEDVALAIDWIEEHFRQERPEGLDLFLMGNSAGGIHVSTFLLAPELAPKRQQITSSSTTGTRLKGAILLSVPFHFERADASRQEVLATYFKDNYLSLSPHGLLKSGIERNSVRDLEDVAVLQITGTLDPEDEILVPNRDFSKEWQQMDRSGSRLRIASLEGHNHLSPVLSLGTGVEAEEAWGQQVIDFVKKSVSC